MTSEELEKYVDHELQWLRYYALEEDRKKLTESSDIYSELRSIGYTKRVIPLHKRCVSCSITSKTNTPFCKYSLLDDLISIQEYKNHQENKFTPLEVYWELFPEKRSWVIEKLNS